MPKSRTWVPATYLDPAPVDRPLKRLDRIEGHVRGVKRMLTGQEDCESILVQASAIRAALNQVIIKLLEGHMETCVADCLKAGDTDEALRRLNSAMGLVLKSE